MFSEVRWADDTLSGSHPGLHGILAEQPPAADALQPPLRCGFRAQLRRSVRRFKLDEYEQPSSHHSSVLRGNLE
jgi:hypothetical protein